MHPGRRALSSITALALLVGLSGVVGAPSAVAVAPDAVTWTDVAPRAADAGAATTVGDATLATLQPGQVFDVAAAPAGQVAIAASAGVWTLASLAPASVATQITSDAAESAVYAADGTLYWATLGAEPLVRRRSTGGAITTLAGGGASPLADGGTGTATHLPAVIDLAVDPGAGLLYLLARSGAEDPSYVDRPYRQVWSLSLTTGALALVAGDGITDEVVIEGTAAADAPLAQAESIAINTTTHALYVATPTSLLRIAAGVVHGPLIPGRLLGLAVTSGGVVEGGGTFLATDGTVSGLPLPDYTSASTILPDGSLLAAMPASVGGLLRRSSIVTPSTGLPAATVSVASAPGELTVTVVPPATAGLNVYVSLLDTTNPYSSGHGAGAFTTTGSTAAHTFTLTRYGDVGDQFANLLDPHRIYRVTVTTTRDDLARRYTADFGTSEADPAPPAAPTSPTVEQQLGTGLSVTVGTPGDVDLDSIVVCLSYGSTPATSPDACPDGRGELQTARQWVPVSVPVTPDVPADYSPLRERTFTAFAVDMGGHASDPASIVVPAATSSSTDPGPVLGIDWAADPGGTTTFRFRTPVRSAAIAAGSTVPDVPGPDTGVVDGETWTTGVLTPGATYTVALARWSDDLTRYTVTPLTFVAGTTSHDVVALSASSVVYYAGRPTVKTVVSRVLADGSGVTPQAGLPVELWSRTAPSATWVRVATGTTAANGLVTWVRPAIAATTTYQVRLPAHGATYPDVVASTVRTTLLKPIVGVSFTSSGTLLSKAARLKVGVPVYIRMAPKRTTTVSVQRYLSGVWRTVATFRTGTTGYVAYKYIPIVKGRTLLRVVSAASTLQTTGISKTMVLSTS